jgi:hypothetical protein
MEETNQSKQRCVPAVIGGILATASGVGWWLGETPALGAKPYADNVSSSDWLEPPAGGFACGQAPKTN